MFNMSAEKEDIKKRLTANLKYSTGWSADNNSIVGRLGGQQVSLSPKGICLDCEETGFRIFVSHSRSALTNKEWALMVYQLYLDEVL